MKHALRLVIGGRQPVTPATTDPAETPQQAEARRLVDAWLDEPSTSVAIAVDDLVRRIAALLAARDGAEPHAAAVRPG